MIADIVAYLTEALGVRVSTSRPVNPPSEMVTVTRTGGVGDRFVDRPLILIHAWGTSDVGACALAERALEAMLEFPDHSDDVSLVTQNSFYTNAYTDGTPRWSVLLECVSNR